MQTGVSHTHVYANESAKSRGYRTFLGSAISPLRSYRRTWGIGAMVLQRQAKCGFTKGCLSCNILGRFTVSLSTQRSLRFSGTLELLSYATICQACRHHMSSSVFQSRLSVLRCFRKGIQGNAGTFLSCFSGVYLIFEVTQTRGFYF